MSETHKVPREALNRFADTGRFVLAGTAIALPLHARGNPARVGSVACLLATKMVAKALKKAVPERRPDGEDDKSFPSEQAAECVASAMIIRREYPGAIGALACGLAGAVSLSRIQSEKHHPWDVAAGVLVGCAAVIASLHLRLAVERRLANAS